MNKNKNKGKTWERELATHLSEVTGKSFLRVPNSGAYVGNSNSFRVEVLTPEQIGMFEGDIITPKEWDHVRFECKFYKKMAWGQLFQPEGESQLNSWIKQSKQGTRPLWFLCFKINNIGKFIVFDFEQGDKYNYNFDNCLTYRVNGIDGMCYIATMDNFFELNKDIIEGLKNDTSNRNS